MSWSLKQENPKTEFLLTLLYNILQTSDENKENINYGMNN